LKNCRRSNLKLPIRGSSCGDGSEDHGAPEANVVDTHELPGANQAAVAVLLKPRAALGRRGKIVRNVELADGDHREWLKPNAQRATMAVEQSKWPNPIWSYKL
jgi:hypothetical protein